MSFAHGFTYRSLVLFGQKPLTCGLLPCCLLFSSPFFWLILSQELCSPEQFLRELSVVTPEPRNDVQKIMFWGLEANLGLDRTACTAPPSTERQLGPSAVSHWRKKNWFQSVSSHRILGCEFLFSHPMIPHSCRFYVLPALLIKLSSVE